MSDQMIITPQQAQVTLDGSDIGVQTVYTGGKDPVRDRHLDQLAGRPSTHSGRLRSDKSNGERFKWWRCPSNRDAQQLRATLAQQPFARVRIMTRKEDTIDQRETLRRYEGPTAMLADVCHSCRNFIEPGDDNFAEPGLCRKCYKTKLHAASPRVRLT
jgi:hypothetical protein